MNSTYDLLLLFYISLLIIDVSFCLFERLKIDQRANFGPNVWKVFLSHLNNSISSFKKVISLKSSVSFHRNYSLCKN